MITGIFSPTASHNLCPSRQIRRLRLPLFLAACLPSVPPHLPKLHLGNPFGNAGMVCRDQSRNSTRHSLAFVSTSFRLRFFGLLMASTVTSPGAAALSNNCRPTLSAKTSTLVLTVAPSRRFLPSLRELAIVSMKDQRLPSGTIFPVARSLLGVHPLASLIVEGIFLSLLLCKLTMPSSSKSWNAFFSVSLLTASKYERSP